MAGMSLIQAILEFSFLDQILIVNQSWYSTVNEASEIKISYSNQPMSTADVTVCKTFRRVNGFNPPPQDAVPSQERLLALRRAQPRQR